MAIDAVLAQTADATVLQDLYTVPVGKRTALYVVATNRTSTPVAYRISFAIGGAVDDPKQYTVYDSTVSTIPQATRRVAFPAGTVVRVFAATADVTFCVNGIEQDV